MSHSVEEKFNEAITAALGEIIEASQELAVATLERGFQRAIEPLASAPSLKRVRRAPPGQRRSPAEIETLAKAFLRVVKKNPGQTMKVLAPMVGSTATELQVPIARLKASGRLRSAGHRQVTRYFPL